MQINTLIISCMDYRLNDAIIAACKDGTAIALRNAGGDAESLMASIEDILAQHRSIKNIKVIVHADCGAMNVAMGIFNDPKSVSNEVARRFERFTSKLSASTSRKELEEEKNPEMQRMSLKKFEIKGIVVKIEIAPVPEKVHEKHVLVVSKPLTREVYAAIGAKLDLSKAYCIGYYKIKDVMPDIEVAVSKLGLKEVYVLPVSENDIEEIRAAQFFKDANLHDLATNQSESSGR
jgi:carbonic anhydrase